MLLIVPKYKLWVNFHPFGALCIAAVLKEKGEKVSLIDGVCEKRYFLFLQMIRAPDNKVIKTASQVII